MSSKLFLGTYLKHDDVSLLECFFMPLVKPVIKIENVIATAALKHRIDLSAVVKAFPVVNYRPERFPGLVYRMNDPKVVIRLFSSGKLVCTGAPKKKKKYIKRSIIFVKN